MNDQDIKALRSRLFDMLDGLKAKTLDPDTAAAMNEVARTMVASAKVEVDFLRVTGASASDFIGSSGAPRTATGIKGITRHLIGD